MKMFRPIGALKESTSNYEDSKTNVEQIKLDQIIAKILQFKQEAKILEQEAIIRKIEQKATMQQ